MNGSCVLHSGPFLWHFKIYFHTAFIFSSCIILFLFSAKVTCLFLCFISGAQIIVARQRKVQEFRSQKPLLIHDTLSQFKGKVSPLPISENNYLQPIRIQNCMLNDFPLFKKSISYNMVGSNKMAIEDMNKTMRNIKKCGAKVFLHLTMFKHGIIN